MTRPSQRTTSRILGWAALMLVPVATLSCNDEDLVCTAILMSTPSGTITWTDGETRVPDRIFIRHNGSESPAECELFLPAAGDAHVFYQCHEGPPGPATLSVLFGRSKWETDFVVESDGCHAAPKVIDLELDPDD